MGHLEESGRKRAKRKNVTAFVLASVEAAGVLGIALVAPNVLGAMKKQGLLPSHRQTESINRARNRLLREGLLVRRDGFLRLTKKGKLALTRSQVSGLARPTRRKWDHKWRILIFDIPNYRKGLRDKVRRTVTAIGFIRLQDSVWVYPHDCEDLVALLKADFKIGKDLLYLIVEELEGDAKLRTAFGIH